MDSNLLKRLTFYADEKTVEETRSETRKQIIDMVVGIVFILIAVYLNDVQMEYLFNESKNSLYRVFKICCLGIGLLEVILSPIALSDVMRIQRNLAQTRVVLYEDRLKGIYFVDPAVDLVGHEFEIMYENIISVNTIVPVGKHGNNLCIETTDKTYCCYAIERSTTAAQRINERVSAAKENN